MFQQVTRRGLVGMVQALWVYRRFVLGMVGRQFLSRYRGSLLGGSWAVLAPMATIAIYLVVFSAVMRGRLPNAAEGDTLGYGLFLCTGILVWTFFAEVVTGCQTVFVEYGNLLKKMAFPRITLPVIVLATAALNFVIVAVLFVAVLLALGRFPGASILAFVPLLLVQQGFAIGLGILLGSLHVFFRDIGQLWVVMLNLWFWSTPIVYPLSILPPPVREAIGWNPLTSLFLAYQRIVLEGTWPGWPDVRYPAAAALVLLVLGLFAFRRLSPEMVDEL